MTITHIVLLKVMYILLSSPYLSPPLLHSTINNTRTTRYKYTQKKSRPVHYMLFKYHLNVFHVNGSLVYQFLFPTHVSPTREICIYYCSLHAAEESPFCFIGAEAKIVPSPHPPPKNRGNMHPPPRSQEPM